MSRAASKKYAKVLLANKESSELGEIKDFLHSLANMFKESKFRDIILSPLVSADDKIAILVANSENEQLKNLLRLLVEKDRLSLIPDIYEELRVAEATRNNRFEGIIYTSTDVKSEVIDELKKNIEKKINAQIDFVIKKSDISGFKVEVPDIGIEASFSNDRLKQQLISHILRGI